VRVAPVLAIVIGLSAAVAGYLVFHRAGTSPVRPVIAPAASPAATFVPSATSDATPVAGNLRSAPSQSQPSQPSAPDGVAAKARRLAGREPYARDDLRRLLERVFAGKLADRELGSEDYERLVDATLRLRAALRVLRGMDESAATAAVREQQRETVRGIFGEIEAITGLPPAELGTLLTSDEDAATP
jgi:hypothetical protein